MKNFHFPLERVLAYRRLQRDIERGRLEQSLAHVRKVEDLAAEIRREGEMTEADVRTSPMDGTQLRSLEGYRGYLKRSANEVEMHRRRAEHAAEQQRTQLVEAERSVRMLEKLESKARAEWQSALQREMEEFASEAFLARWKQR